MAATSEERSKKIVDFVVTEFERYEKFHAERFDKCRKIYKHWKNEAPKREHDWQNAVNVPLMIEGEQTITPRLFTALFPTDAPLDVHVEGDQPEEQGIRIKGIIQHFFRVCNVQGESLPTMTQNTLFGTGYLEGGQWYQRTGYVHDEQGNRFPKLIEARPDARFVSFFEMYPHPAKRRMGDTLPIIRRRYIDGEALKRMANDSSFESGKLKAALDSDPPESTQKFDQKREREYEVLEYWGLWNESLLDEKPNTTAGVPYWIIVINRKVEIRCIPNPFNHQMPPFCKIKMFTDPDSHWFGLGIGQAGLATQERVNKIVNQRLDNVDLVLNKQGFYNGNDPLVNVKGLQVSRPGKWHKVSDTMASIRWMDTPDVTNSSYQEEAAAKQDFREATGAVANLMPEAGSEHRTAMGIQLLQGTAGVRFQPILRQMETDLIGALAMFFFSNLRQFMSQSEWVLVTGKDGAQKPINISPEQLEGKVFFIPTGISETINKETQVGQLLRFKEITTQDPTVNRQEINRRIAELFGFKDINKLLTPIKLPQQGQLDAETQMRIQQRVAEGADPESIKQELLGARPIQSPQEFQRNQQQGAGA